MSSRTRQWVAFSVLAATLIGYLLLRAERAGGHDVTPASHIQPTAPSNSSERPFDRDFKAAMQQESRALAGDAGAH